MSVAFASGDVKRVFIACRQCRRVQPHYRVYGPPGTRGAGLCRACGGTEFKPMRIAEWRAAWWVLVVGWFWRKTIRHEQFWDPRMPIRTLA